MNNPLDSNKCFALYPIIQQYVSRLNPTLGPLRAPSTIMDNHAPCHISQSAEVKHKSQSTTMCTLGINEPKSIQKLLGSPWNEAGRLAKPQTN